MDCTRCASDLPNRYTYAGPHIKEVCSNCGFYIRFAPKQTIPSMKESKQHIWCVTNDLKLIEEIKTKMAVFHKDLKGMDANVAYHNLHVEILKHFSKKVSQTDTNNTI